MNKTFGTWVLEFAACSMHLTHRPTVYSDIYFVLKWTTTKKKICHSSPMMHIKYAELRYSWRNYTSNCKTWVWCDKFMVAFYLVWIYLQDGHRIGDVAKSIYKAINLLLQKTTPENIKCVCQTLKVRICSNVRPFFKISVYCVVLASIHLMRSLRGCRTEFESPFENNEKAKSVGTF